MLFQAKNSELLIPEENLTDSGKKNVKADVIFENVIFNYQLNLKVAITHVLSLLDWQC